MPVLLVSLTVSGPDCVAVMTGVGGVAGAPPGIASAAAMPTEAAHAASRRRRTRDPDRLAIAAMSFASLELRQALRDYKRTRAAGIRTGGQKVHRRRLTPSSSGSPASSCSATATPSSGRSRGPHAARWARRRVAVDRAVEVVTGAPSPSSAAQRALVATLRGGVVEASPGGAQGLPPEGRRGSLRAHIEGSRRAPPRACRGHHRGARGRREATRPWRRSGGSFRRVDAVVPWSPRRRLGVVQRRSRGSLRGRIEGFAQPRLGTLARAWLRPARAVQLAAAPRSVTVVYVARRSPRLINERPPNEWLRARSRIGRLSP